MLAESAYRRQLVGRTLGHVLVSVLALEAVDVALVTGVGRVAPGVYVVAAAAGVAFGLVWSNGDRFLVDRDLQPFSVTRRGASVASVDLDASIEATVLAVRAALGDLGARDVVVRADGSLSGVVGSFAASVCVPSPRRWMAELAAAVQPGEDSGSRVVCCSRFRLRQGFYARVNQRRADQLANAVSARLGPH